MPQYQVSIRDSRTVREDRRWIESVYPQFLVDLAPSATGRFPLLSEFGRGVHEETAPWFADQSAHIMTALYGEARVGFALVRTADVGGAREYRMSDFFIDRAHRRRGIGAQVVRLLLDRFNGRWLISESVGNTDAVSFWRSVVMGYTHGRYQERIVNGEVQQRFESGPRR